MSPRARAAILRRRRGSPLPEAPELTSLRLRLAPLLSAREREVAQPNPAALLAWVQQRTSLPASFLAQAQRGPLCLGPYEVTGRLGRGGMGAVLRGRAVLLARLRAERPELTLVGNSAFDRSDEFAKLGVLRFLRKPWRPQELLDLLG